MSAQTDELVLQLFTKAKEKKKEIAKIGKHSWLTSCSLSTTENVNDRVNIQTITDIKKLIYLYCFLINLSDRWSQATKVLGLKEPCVWQGYKVEEWQLDIQARVKQVGLNAQKKELEALEEKLYNLTTIEQRKKMELDDLANNPLLQ